MSTLSHPELYPCSLCGEEHERSVLIPGVVLLFCRECWLREFGERKNGYPDLSV